MIRWLLALILFIFGLLLGVGVASYLVERNRAPEITLIIGERASFLRAGEATIFDMPKGEALYVVRLARPLKHIPGGPIAGGE